MTSSKDKEKEIYIMENYWTLKEQLPNKETQKVVNDFLMSLKLANRSKLTIISYRRFLERFFMDQEEIFSSLSSETILKWYKPYFGKVHVKTYKHRLGILSSFYTFCVQEGYLDRSPIKRRWFPRLPKSLPKYLEKEEVAKIRQQIEGSPLRNQALVEFMLATGCRVDEIHRLTRQDVDLENRTAKVFGKGKKIRQVYFTDKCALLLERYFATTKDDNSTPAFVSFKSGKSLSTRRIHDIVQEIGIQADVDKLHPHRFRHTFATTLLAKGAELSFISEALGHGDLRTTQIYAHLPKSEIIAQYRKFMGG